MACGKCVSSVESAVAQVPGVEGGALTPRPLTVCSWCTCTPLPPPPPCLLPPSWARHSIHLPAQLPSTRFFNTETMRWSGPGGWRGGDAIVQLGARHRHRHHHRRGERRRHRRGVPVPPRGPGRGLHSSTFLLNLRRFCHSRRPAYHLTRCPAYHLTR
jgi:hypothetical protein